MPPQLEPVFLKTDTACIFLPGAGRARVLATGSGRLSGSRSTPCEKEQKQLLGLHSTLQFAFLCPTRVFNYILALFPKEFKALVLCSSQWHYRVGRHQPSPLVGKETEVQRGLEDHGAMSRSWSKHSGQDWDLSLWRGLDCSCRKFPEPSFSWRFGACSAWGCPWPPALSQVRWVKLDASWLVQAPGISLSPSGWSSGEQ